jgi:hypothetical protein
MTPDGDAPGPDQVMVEGQRAGIEQTFAEPSAQGGEIEMMPGQRDVLNAPFGDGLGIPGNLSTDADDFAIYHGLGTKFYVAQNGDHLPTNLTIDVSVAEYGYHGIPY